MELGARKAGSSENSTLISSALISILPSFVSQQEVAQNEDSALGNEAFMTRVFQISYEHDHHPLHALFSVLSLMNLRLNQQF